MVKFEMTQEELLAKQEAILSLVKHPGWKYFEAMLDDTINAAYSTLSKASDGIVMAKHLGVHVTATGFKTWAERELTGTRNYLEQLALDKLKTPNK